MSPKNRKKRVRVRSPGRLQLPSNGNTIVPDLPDGDVDRTNAKLHVVVAVLGASSLLAEISAESPLNIAANGSAESSGLQAPFAQGSYDVSMRKNSEYTAGVNIFSH